MAEGDNADAWAQVARKITDIKDYTKEKEFYLSQLLDSVNGFAYPVEGFNSKVYKFCCGVLTCICLPSSASRCSVVPSLFNAVYK